MKRLFIGFEIPASIRDALAEISQTAGKDVPAARWVKSENMHVTIKFLGNCDDALVPPIQTALAPVAAACSSFRLSLAEVGGFPTLKRARVFWAGFSELPPPLLRLYQEVEQAMRRLGFEREMRDYRPHLTLARLKIPQDLTAVAESVDRSIFSEPFLVDKLVLFESKLYPTGAVYSQLATWRLGY